MATGTNDEKLKKIKEKNKNINILKFDLSNHKKIEEFVEECNKILSNKIDVLINNAGVAGKNTTVVDYPLDEWKKVIDLNLNAVFIVVKQ